MHYSRLIATADADTRWYADARPATAHRRTILMARRSSVLARALRRLRGRALPSRPASTQPRTATPAACSEPCEAARP